MINGIILLHLMINAVSFYLFTCFSYGLFRLFDDVMFLAKGGRTVYLGPVDDVEEYFFSMSIVVPERINPPDHFMDVLEGIAKPEGIPGFNPKILPLKWIEHNGYPVPDDLRALAASLDGSKNDDHVPLGNSLHLKKSFYQELWHEFTSFGEVKWDDFKSLFSRTQDLSQRRTPGFFNQFKFIVFRFFPYECQNSAHYLFIC